MGVLMKKNFHPTAEEIYDVLKKDFPCIGIATVYRNLDQLARSGTVIKIENPDGAARYDGNPEKHYHIKCLQCGRIDDVWTDIDINKHINLKKIVRGFNVLEVIISFAGICDECALNKH